MYINNYEQVDKNDNNSLDVNYNMTDEQDFNNEYIDKNLFKGAHVVLVSDDNPWYINKGVPLKYVGKDFTMDVNPYDTHMYPYEEYKSRVKMNMNKPDLGFGHSYLQRTINMTGGPVEGFSGSSDTMNRNILISLLVFIIIVWLYRRYRK